MRAFLWEVLWLGGFAACCAAGASAPAPEPDGDMVVEVCVGR